MANLKEEFLLDPTVVFLNHGSFGATPKVVFANYQEWQRRLEKQPVEFMGRELAGHLDLARDSLGQYLNAQKSDLVYIPNATFGLNIVARSLKLESGDEVLATDHEYGACSNTWQFLSRRYGFEYIQKAVPLSLDSAEDFVDEFWQGVNPRTKVIYLSHITSPTAACFPIREICGRAREAGILSVVDGAHAPGQIPLDMERLGADFYFGNAHKWMCSPKGAAFLYARREVQDLIEPLVVSWGWGENRTRDLGSQFLNYLQSFGTNDFSAYLAVPAAIEFQEKHDWPTVRQECHLLLRQALERLEKITAKKSPYKDDSFYHQMAVVPLPPISDLKALKASLYDEYRVEIPCIQWGDHQFIRISIQAYNSQSDVETLITAVTELLPKYRA